MTWNIATRPLGDQTVQGVCVSTCGKGAAGLGTSPESGVRGTWRKATVAPTARLFWLASLSVLACFAAVEVLGRCEELGGLFCGTLRVGSQPIPPALPLTSRSCAAHSFADVHTLPALPALRLWCATGSARGGICALVCSTPQDLD